MTRHHLTAAIGPEHSIHLEAPDFTHIPWEVIARNICAKARFNNAFGTVPTVGGHSIHVADALPSHLRLYGLLHDAHECAMGDITRPVKAFEQRRWDAYESLDFEPDDYPLVTLEETLQAAIFEKAGAPWPLGADDAALLRTADDAACQVELEAGRSRKLRETFVRDYLQPHPDTYLMHLRAALDALHSDKGAA